MFLLPGYAIANHVCGVEIPPENKLEIIRYLSNLQSEDGGWGRNRAGREITPYLSSSTLPPLRHPH
jgi:hypothetical protein